VTVPDGVDATGLLTAMRTEHGVVLAGGQDALSGKIFRIGHMGRCTAEDIQDVLDALERVLPQVGFKG
jgi:aspartate aminotransferase-like enzyme